MARSTLPTTHCALATAIAALLAVPAAVAAEGAGQDAGKLGEIIVTAQKREQNLQDVGTSVTAFDAKLLERLGLKDVTAVAGQVPGLQFNQYGATVTIYNLRGVSQNDFSDHQEAPVAVYADDAYIASTGALAGSLFDLQRVEVLRGPQGTLFGRNATGGLIHYVSRAPTDAPEGFLTVTGGNFGTFESEGAISGPLADGVNGRLSFSTAHHDGYIRNLIGKSINDQKQYAGRAQLAFKAAGADVLVKVHALTNDNETAGNYSWAASTPDATGRGTFTPGTDLFGYQGNPADPFTQSEDRRGIFNRTVWGSTLHATWSLAGATLVSVTDYLHLQKRYGEDSDVSPNPVFNYDTYQHYQQFSEELRLNGTQGALRWIGGLYYLNYRTRDLAVVTLDPIFGGVSGAAFGLRTSSVSGFGQLEYDLAPQWTVIAGARYTYDDKKFDFDYEPQGLIYNGATAPGAKRTFNIPTGKLELDFKLDRDQLVYGSVNRGAKGGGWSAPTSGLVNPADLPYDQEKLTSFELGYKSTFLDGAARLNAALFYYDYKNYQGFFLKGLTQVVENRDAKVKGGEVEFAIVPAAGFNLQVGLSNLSSSVDGVPTPAGQVVTTEMPQAPRWSLNAVARYEWAALGGKLALEADAKWNAKQYLELLNAPVDLQDAYTVGNARLSYAAGSGAWDVAAYVKNVADRHYRIYNLDLAAIGFNQGVYAPPRLYGASFTYHWGK